MSEPMEIARREKEKEANPDVRFTGISIEDNRAKGTTDYQKAIIEAVIIAIEEGEVHSPQIKAAVDDYHRYLRHMALQK